MITTYEKNRKQKLDTLMEAMTTIKRIVSNPYKFVNRVSITIVGAHFDTDFNMLTITGDGFPQARFVFSHDFSQVRFVFGGEWKNNHKLMYLTNSPYIPPAFPVENLAEELKKITI
jgi:hypothetical protein